jgi:acyl-CoA thioester hydrolase
MNSSDYKHKITVKVRFNEVDMLGVCNNAVYINYFEQARLDYFKNIGLIPHDGLFSDGRLFYVVRNEINYSNPAKFDDELEIYSRISLIKNSSFKFEHLIIKRKSKLEVANGSGIIVQVDPKTMKSLELPQNFYEKVRDFDSNVEILKK